MTRITLVCFSWIIVLVISASTVIARDLPDLVIVGADLRHSGDCSGKRPLVVGPVKVKNTGQGRGQIFTTKVMLKARTKTYPELRGDDRFVNSMRPEETIVVDVRIHSARPVSIDGPVELELTVDPVNVFPEENEQNNTVRVTVNVRCAQ